MSTLLTPPLMDGVGTIAHVIQLAVAPVFLLTGVGAILGVLANRLARVVDRARSLELRRAAADGDAARRLDVQLLTLSLRAKLIGRAITLCTLTALLVASVIITLFLGAFVPFDLTVPVAAMFILAMLSLIAALIGFLREVFMATRSLRIDSGSPSGT
ncbi:DUF2721 domain-containing protein [Sinimarinibacterium sp. CAU 1509]|uniref:DUF2721 domain-containing protein n=1 Tax=Sinimarinibacterium sp. CAU 1509 TaxID=2562283 RepID=UPI001B7F9F5B|nr:DUF2721 domain-containing protein [Sinimarinibacterium sp. CAU 1509]